MRNHQTAKLVKLNYSVQLKFDFKFIGTKYKLERYVLEVS